MEGGRPLGGLQEGWSRRELLLSVGAGVTALSGCSGLGPGGTDGTATPTVDPDTAPSLLLMSLMPTVMVRFNSEVGDPDRWVPRQIINGTSGNLRGWQIAFHKEKSDTSYTVPAHLIVGGNVRDQNIPSPVELSGGAGVDSVTIEPTHRGRYTNDMGLVSNNIAEQWGSKFGTLSMSTTVEADNPLLSIQSDTELSATTFSTNAPPDAADAKHYNVFISLAEDWQNALRRGYNELKTLFTLSTIVFTAGVGTLQSASGNIAGRFVIELGKETISTGLQEAASIGTLNVIEGLASDGSRISDLGQEDLQQLRALSGTIKLDPPTTELENAVSVSSLREHVGHAEFANLDDMRQAGVGFTGPIIQIQGTQTAQTDENVDLAEALEGVRVTLTVTDSTGSQVGSVSATDSRAIEDYGRRIQFATIGDFKRDGDNGIVDFVRIAGGRTVENWSERDLDDYTMIQDGGGRAELVSSPTADGPRALKLSTGPKKTTYRSNSDLLSIDAGTSVNVDLRHQTDNSETYAMRTSFAMGVDADGQGGISVGLANPGSERTPGATLATSSERKRIEFTPELNEFYTFSVDIGTG